MCLVPRQSTDHEYSAGLIEKSCVLRLYMLFTVKAVFLICAKISAEKRKLQTFSVSCGFVESTSCMRHSKMVLAFEKVLGGVSL